MSLSITIGTQWTLGILINQLSLSTYHDFDASPSLHQVTQETVNKNNTTYDPDGILAYTFTNGSHSLL